MATQTQRFDVLNNMITDRDSGNVIPIERYFNEMDLSDEDKEKRIALAYDLQGVFNRLFTLVTAYIVAGYDVDYELLSGIAVMRYIDALKTQGIDLDDKYPTLTDYVARIVSEIVLTTKDNLGKPYYLSEDRATNIAENESNTVFNTVEFQDAIDKGYTKKTWRTFKDSRVRRTHLIADGETIGIHDVFHVGDSLMRYPKDEELGASAKEIVNCRCVVKYSR